MLGLVFLFPAILAAAAAAAAPVIIHLVMRTKPRRIVFPAMRFVKKTHQANLSMLRVKHLILLAMRMLAIVLLAMLIARWVIRGYSHTSTPTGPIAAVLVLDNSGSMEYRLSGTTRLDQAKQMAGQILSQLPPGSQVAVLDTGDPAGAATFVSDMKLAGQQVLDVPPTSGHASLGPCISRAVGILGKSQLPNKVVCVLTDMTQQAWRDAASQKADGIDFDILDCGVPQDTNVALGELRLGMTAVPAGVEVPLETTVFSTTAGGDRTIEVELDGAGVFQRTISIVPGQENYLEIASEKGSPIKPSREGLIGGRVKIKEPDGLEMDNVRYFSLLAGPTPRVLMVCENTSEMTYFMLSRAAQGAIGVETIPSDQFTPEKLSGVKIVVLAGGASVADAQWKALDNFVRGGGRLWVVAGPLMAPTSYDSPAAQKLMPAALGSFEELGKVAAWRSPAVGEPLLAPFMSERNPALNKVLCKGRFSLSSTAADAHVVLAYADNVPAIVTRTVGEGSVLWWNFSPAPKHLGAADEGQTQFAVLTQHTMRTLAMDQGLQTSYIYGQEAVVPIPKGMGNPTITLQLPGQNEQQVTPDYKRSAVVIKSVDKLGQYLVRFSEPGKKVERGFSVNADVAESDLRQANKDNVKHLFPDGHVTISREVQPLSQRQSTQVKDKDLSLPLLLAILALLTGEAFFANRFYKKPAEPVNGAK